MARSAQIQQVSRLSSVCLLVLGLALACWSFTEVDRPYALVNTVGSLERLNAGQVSPWDFKTINPANTLGGFGAGTINVSTGMLKKYSMTGEMLSFCGRTFIRITDPTGAPKVMEMTGAFSSPFALTLTEFKDPKRPGKLFEEVFPRTYRLLGNEPQLLHSVLENLAIEGNSPIAVVGWAEMPRVDGIALKKAPGGDQLLYGDRKDEYLESIQATDAHLVFFAVVSPMLPIQPLANAILATQAFDLNPDQGQPAAALIHAHGALVNEAVPCQTVVTSPILLDGLKRVTVNDILHVYGTSSIKNGAFIVYRLRYQ